MSQSYTRQSTFADGDTITAALFNNEYNQLVNAFSYSSTNEGTTGHRHDGSAGEGGNIPQIGDLDFLNKIVVDSTNNRWGFYVQVASSAVEQIRLQDGALIPVTDSDVDLGTSSLYFKDAYIDSVTTTGNVSIGGNLTVTGNATISGNLTFGDADTDSINLAAEIDSNVIPNTDNTYDLGSSSKEWKDIYIDGTAYLDAINFNGTVITSTAAELNILDGVTSTAAELNILDGVTATTAEINTLDGITSTVAELNILDGVTATSTEINILDGVTSTTAELNILDGVTANAAELNILDGVTSTTAELNILDGVTSTAAELNILDGKAFLDEDNMASNSATGIASQQSIKSYVDAQVTAQDLDIITDSGTIAIDLDSENLTVSGGTGLDSSATGNAVTLAIDSTVTTLTGTQTLTNKTLTTPVISSISNTGTLTLPTSTDTLVGRATTDTLTNKTLTSPVINTGVSGTAFLDDDTFATATASTLASSESIKAYVDTTVAATNEVVEDSTPQLGGDLDLNSNDITGTGNINITGTIQSSGNITGTLATAAQPNITSVGTLTGLDVAGTPTFDGLTVDGAATINGTTPLLYLTESDTTDLNSRIRNTAGNLQIHTANDAQNSFTARVNISHSTGDISFYEDTGTTQALFWDASAESLGIGTTSPSSKLHVIDSSTADSKVLRLSNGYTTDAANDAAGIIFGLYRSYASSVTDSGFIKSVKEQAWDASSDRDAALTFGTRDGASEPAERMRIDSSGNVGIGTTSPSAKLEVTGATLVSDDGTDDFVKQSVSGTTSTLSFGNTESTGGIAKWQYNRSTGSFSGFVGTAAATEFMTIDSSGNVGIGTSSPSGPLHISTADSAISRLVGSSSSGTNFGIANTSTGNAQLLLDGSNGDFTGGDYVILRQNNDLSGEFTNVGSNPLLFSTANTERMRIDSSGKVGIGTSSPNENLHVHESTTPRILLTDSTTGTTSGADGMFIGIAGDQGLNIWNYENTYTRFAVNNAEKMRIDSSGNVGIGTSSPNAALDAVGSSNVVGEFTSTATSKSNATYTLMVDSSAHTSNLSSAGAMSVDVNSGRAFTINGLGRVGIGTDSPSQPLHVDASGGGVVRVTRLGNSASAYGQLEHDGTNTTIKSSAQLIFNSGGSETARIDSSGNLLVGGTSSGQDDSFAVSSSGNITIARASGSSRTMASFLNGGSTVGSIVTSTTATAYNTSSDARLKDVTGEARGLEVINELNPVAYNWKADGKADEGLIAQEVQEIVPNAVSGSEEEHYQMDYSKLVVHLVKGMKEQQTQIEALQSEINLLKGE